MSEPGGVNSYDISNLLEENKLITLSPPPPKPVHFIMSQGGPPILKASMTKPRNAAKTAGYFNSYSGKTPRKDALGHENKQNEILNTSENMITLFKPL